MKKENIVPLNQEVTTETAKKFLEEILANTKPKEQINPDLDDKTVIENKIENSTSSPSTSSTTEMVGPFVIKRGMRNIETDINLSESVIELDRRISTLEEILTDCEYEDLAAINKKIAELKALRVIEKIIAKSKQIRFKKMMAYHNNFESSVPYEAEIVKNEKCGDGYFLVQKCMIFTGQSLSNSEYCIYEFDSQGEYKFQRDTNELGFDFFKLNSLIKKIEF